MGLGIMAVKGEKTKYTVLQMSSEKMALHILLILCISYNFAGLVLPIQPTTARQQNTLLDLFNSFGTTY